MKIDVDPDWWKSLFDEIYLKTDARSVCDESLTRREVDFISGTIPLRTEERILDMCGGHGRHSIEMCRRGFRRCTVLDYSRPLLRIGFEKAKRQGLSVRFVQSDARRSGLADETFHHALILGNSLGYAPGKASDVRMLIEARRILKTGGWLLVDVTDGDRVREHFAVNAWHEIGEDIVVCRQRQIRGDLVYSRELVLAKTGGMIRDRTYRLRLYGSEDLEKLLNTAGFRSIRVRLRFRPFQRRGNVGFMNKRMIGTARK